MHVPDAPSLLHEIRFVLHKTTPKKRKNLFIFKLFQAFFIANDHANACASRHSLVVLHNILGFIAQNVLVLNLVTPTFQTE
jgi:hypothetical protein